MRGAFLGSVDLMPSREDPTTREMSRLEQLYYWRNRLNCYRNVISWATYSKRVPRETLAAALTSLIRKENSLALNTLDGELLGPVSQIVFDDVVDYREVTRVDRDLELSKLHDIKFEMDSDTPLWKLVVFNGEHLAFVTDHMICDGTSIANFQKLLLDELNRGDNSDDSSTLLFDRDATDVYFPGQLEQYISTLPGPRFMLRTIGLELGPSWLASWLRDYPMGKHRLSGRVYDRQTSIEASLKTNVQTIGLSPKSLKALLQVCKEHDVKLTSLLSYITLQALDSKIPQDNKPCDYIIQTPINMRKYLDMDAIKEREPRYTAKLWCLPSGVLTNVPSPAVEPEDTIQWDVVQGMNKSLHTQAKSQDPVWLWGMLRVVSPYQVLARQNGKQSRLTLENSNLGFFKFNTESDKAIYTIEDIYFTQCCGVIGANVDVNVIGFEGGLRLGFTWDDAMPESAEVPEVVRLVQQRIDQLISPA